MPVEHYKLGSNAIGCSYYLWAILGSSLSVCISLMGASATHVPRVSAQSVLCTSVLVSPTGLPFGAVGLNGYNRWGEFQHTLTECLALLHVVINLGSYACGGTKVGPPDGAYCRSVL